jgi:hypothetical protein
MKRFLLLLVNPFVLSMIVSFSPLFVQFRPTLFASASRYVLELTRSSQLEQLLIVFNGYLLRTPSLVSHTFQLLVVRFFPLSNGFSHILAFWQPTIIEKSKSLKNEKVFALFSFDSSCHQLSFIRLFALSLEDC